jgi:uncharacterized protein YaaN involved in tellurite resistance
MDINQSTAPTTTAAPPTLTPPLTLTPPAEVAVIEPQQAEGMLPITAERRTQLGQMAQQEIETIAGLQPNSPEMSQKVDELADLGRAEIIKAGGLANRMLQRPAAALDGNSGKAPDTPQGKVSKTLADLRHTIEELSPAGADLGASRKLLGIIPFGKRIDRYFDKYRSAQSHLDAITRALVAGQDELRKDNAAIDTERREMYGAMEKLSEWAFVLQALDDAAENKRLQLENTNPQAALDFQSRVLFAIRQRRTDVLTQLAVTAQGYLAMDMVKQNNAELIRGVDRARSTTLSALRTAVIVSQALASQKLVLEQISALNATTSQLIANNAALLRSQGAAIQQQAASSTVEIAKLEQAFTDVFAAIDELDRFRAQAATSMQGTVTLLQGQMERAKPYLARATRVDTP